MKKILTKGFLDTEKEKIIGNAVLLLKRGSYKILKPSTSKDKAGSINACENDLYDLTHLYVLPAFIDSHVHLSLNGKNFETSISQWDKPKLFNEKIKERLKNTYKAGIGALRDGSDKIHSGLIAKNIGNRPYVIATGEGIRRQGYYGSFLGKGLGEPQVEIEDKLKELKEKGADQVKVILSGVVSFNEYGKVGKLQFTARELERIVELARELNLPVMTHVNSKAGIKLAVSAGVHSIEHGYFMTEELLKGMAAKNIYWIPTIAAVANQVCKRESDYTRNQKEIIKRTYTNQLKMLKKARDLGVKIGVGTDAGAVGVEHGMDYFTELRLFREGGLSNNTILKAATCWNREILQIGPENNLGFIGVKDNPLNKLETLKEPEIIFS